MIVDTSAVLAILNREEDREVLARALLGPGTPRMSTATWVEATRVVDLRRSPVASQNLDALVERAGIEFVDFTAEHARIARSAHQRYGRGTGHPAKLNLGDCFSYALAKATDEPLLFKGDDFSKTDIRSAL